ncbi:MAG: hypothetical protein O2794_00705 [bacterium]|nr:hypothetical protein [bacterium]
MSRTDISVEDTVIYRGLCPERDHPELYVVDESGDLVRGIRFRLECREHTLEEILAIVEFRAALVGIKILDVDTTDTNPEEDVLGPIYLIHFVDKGG